MKAKNQASAVGGECLSTVRTESSPQFDNGWLSANLVRSKNRFGQVVERKDLERIASEQMDHLRNFPKTPCHCGGSRDGEELEGTGGHQRAPYLAAQGPA